MKITELRIGNIIIGCEEFIVVGIHDHGVECEGLYRPANNGCYDINTLKEIPLTEEWLLKFGFKNYFVGFTKGSFCIEDFSPGFFFTGGSGIRMSIEIKNVHQLQNLYFALTGEELTIINQVVESGID